MLKLIPKKQAGGIATGFKGAKDWTQSYINSPMYKQRLMRMNNTEKLISGEFPGGGKNNPVNQQIQQRGASVAGITPQVVPEIPGDRPGEKTLAAYDTLGGGQTLRVRQDVASTPAATATMAHELSHGSLNGGQPYSQSFDYKYVSPMLVKPGGGKFTSTYSPYIQSPTEMKARLDSIRFQMQKKGIHDARTQEFTPEQLKRLQADKEITGSQDYKDLNSQLPGNRKNAGMMWLFNNIAQNKTANDGVVYAQQGTKLVKRDAPTKRATAGSSFGEGDMKEIVNQENWVDNWYKHRKTFNNPFDGEKSGLATKSKPYYSKVDFNKKFPGRMVLGQYDPLFGDAGQVMIEKREKVKGITPLHEYNHYVQWNNLWDDKNYEDKVDNPINKLNLRNNPGFWHSEDRDYITDPGEVQSMLMEYRYLNDLKPDQRIDRIDRKNHKLSPPSAGFFNNLKDEQLIELLNKVVTNKPATTNVRSAQLGGILSKLNPRNWGVKDYSTEGSFDSAYSKAKRGGNKEFMFKDKRYSTAYGGTPNQEVKKYGVNGQRISDEAAASPVTVNKFSILGEKYLPGHISASVHTGKVSEFGYKESKSIDYGPKGNYGSDDNSYNKTDIADEIYNVYNVDKGKLIKKSDSLKGIKDWSLIGNNCADNVCDGLGLKRDMLLTTPRGTVSKIKEQFPTLDIKGRTRKDYLDEIPRDLRQKLSVKNYSGVLKNAKTILSSYQDPELKAKSNYVTGIIQSALVSEGYNIKDDGINGPQTQKALNDYLKSKK